MILILIAITMLLCGILFVIIGCNIKNSYNLSEILQEVGAGMSLVSALALLIMSIILATNYIGLDAQI